ncbi:YchJ family protein [Paeniglutamicibacter terrestris]|uniref:UPF0225 protein HED64_10645 n=1 Tax=Paeniglutamicibacter terrestris TaxID=2723403 RepID=A0ABX1G4J0_9MICC|nr:YchJ family metal-binding protein [Paeniglutamicibacter terrestris]ASN40670.1 hypothetical protein CGQ24_17820 [Arthrobacter sp. 7749]NKG21160.1 hypothetical protein [Paeniglutamicibacter terrestris]
MHKDTRCPCNSGETYSSCCGRYHQGFNDPEVPLWPGTAETLMRSRFSAFAANRPDYLLATWFQDTRPAELELDTDMVWRSLEIVNTEAGGPFDSTGVVEFIARYKQGKKTGAQHEVSSFVRANGRWYYLDAAD